MKHIALAVWFASSFLQSAVGQQPAAPQVWSKAAQLELAQAIAVEEQEKDLTKAELLLRAARKATGTAMTMPASVPSVAMFSVSHTGHQSCSI